MLHNFSVFIAPYQKACLFFMLFLFWLAGEVLLSVDLSIVKVLEVMLNPHIRDWYEEVICYERYLLPV